VDAFNIMIQRGSKFIAEKVGVWEDCGKLDTLLQTNQYLLNKAPQKKHENAKKSLIIPPVAIEDGADVENSIIGPYVSISKNAKIKNSIIQNSLIGEGAHVDDAQLKDSIIGDFAKIKGVYKTVNISDDSEIIYGKDEHSK
jgi:glucose-1-phosphate thymidylyltransferase